MVYTIREVSQSPINVSGNLLNNTHNNRVSYRNHYYTTHEETRSQAWRISKLVQALVLIIFSFGFAYFSEHVRTLLKQGLTGKETIKMMVQREHIPITPTEERSLELIELEKTLKNSVGVAPFNPKIGEKCFKLCIKHNLLTKENCQLFKNTKILDFSEANFPLNKELIDTLFTTCGIIEIIKLEGSNGPDFSNLRLSQEEPSTFFDSSLNWIESVRYLIQKHREGDRRFWLKIENFPMQLICFMNSQEIIEFYKILNEQSGKLARTWINNLSQEIKNHGPTAEMSKKLSQATGALFKEIPEEDAITFLTLTSQRELEDKLEILAPLILNAISLKSLQIFLVGLDQTKSSFLAQLLSSIASHKNLKILDAKVRVIMQKLILQKPAKEILSKLYHHEYLRKILMEFIDFDQFKELSEEVITLVSSLDYDNQVVEFCVFLNSITMNKELKEHFQRIQFFLSSLQNSELLEAIMKESQKRGEYDSQLSIDFCLFAFITLIEQAKRGLSDHNCFVVPEGDLTATEWIDFAKQLSELYTDGVYKDSDALDTPAIIINSFSNSSFKQPLVLSFIEPILAEDQEEHKLIFKIFKAFWKNEDFEKLNTEGKKYLSDILLLIRSESQLIDFLNSMKENQRMTLISLIKEEVYKVRLTKGSMTDIFEMFNQSPGKHKRTGSLMQQVKMAASPIKKASQQIRS